jgi:hypothetical protein
MDRIVKQDATEPGKHTPSTPVKRQPAAPGTPKPPTFRDHRKETNR